MRRPQCGPASISAAIWATAGALGQLACDATCSGGNGAFGGVSPAGWLGGVQGGYNWQGYRHLALFFGIETDIQASTILGQGSSTDGAATNQNCKRLEPCAAAPVTRWIARSFYFTGGLAYGSVHNEAADGTYANNANSVVMGYVLGGGLEYKVKRDLSFKVEYQYVNLGKNDPSDPTGAAYSAEWRHRSRRCVQHRARRR